MDRTRLIMGGLLASLSSPFTVLPNAYADLPAPATAGSPAPNMSAPPTLDPLSLGETAPPTAPPPLNEPVELADSAAEAPAPPVPEAAPGNDSAARGRQEHLRVYEWTRPNWGLQFSGSAKSMGGEDINSFQTGNPMRAINVQFEWQPEWIQSIGVLGIGPSVGIYPIAGAIVPSGDMGIDVLSNWAAGGQARYQLRIFHEQPLVPVVGYEVEYLSYHLPFGGPAGRLLVQGPVFGAMLFLNFLEPSVASEGYVTNGISRTYLVAELRLLSGTDTNVIIGGKSYFFGLRFEF